MAAFNEIFNSSDLTVWTVVFRLLLSLVLGGTIGIERELDKQPAGLRTHILISVGATLIMLVSISVPRTYSNFSSGDPARIAAQVVSGIGFLGAGAILRMGINIRGLTTAASIWIVAALGLAVGAGIYIASAVTTVLILFALVVLKKVEDRLFGKDDPRLLELIMKGENVESAQIRAIIEEYADKIYSTKVSQSVDSGEIKLQFYTDFKKNFDCDHLFAVLKQNRKVKKIRLK